MRGCPDRSRNTASLKMRAENRTKAVVTNERTPSIMKIVRGTSSLIAMRADRMVAFVEGSKGGTWDAIAQANRFRRPCEVRR